MKAGIELANVFQVTKRGQKGGFVHIKRVLCMNSMHMRAHTKPQVSGGFWVFVHGRVHGLFWCAHKQKPWSGYKKHRYVHGIARFGQVLLYKKHNSAHKRDLDK